ncbi:MAG: alpha/beta-hydrolase family protein, partial [Acidimicrobiia bacterium]
TGTAGGVVGLLQELTGSGGRPRRSLAALVPVAGALAALNTWQVRRREELDRDLPPEGSDASLAKSIAYGAGLAVALSAFASGERAFADVLSRAMARVLPGNEMMWRPAAHAATLAGLGYAGRFLSEQTLHRIEQAQESVEAAFDVPPPNEFVSGSFESLVPFATLSRAGRRFVWTVSLPDVIEEVMAEPAGTTPIRAYVGIESAPTEDDRVELMMRELERTHAFDRAWIMFASPTGTGYVNYAAATILEFLTLGNCATVAMQYSARPSPLSLDRVAEGRHHARKLISRLQERIARCPAGTRPKLLLFGESLGAWTSQDAFAPRGTQGLVDDGVDHAIWIGTPYFSKWKDRVLNSERPDVDPTLVGVFNDIGEWQALDPAARDRIRYVMITHYDDGVAVFGPTLAVQAPEWLRGESRPRTVPKGMRWMPTTTFFQVLVDMKNAANVVPGVFAARGHDYRADLLPFFHETLKFDATPDQLARIGAWLEQRELIRSNWMKTHKTVDQSLAAAVLDRLLREERAAGTNANDRIVNLVRTIAFEEFDAGSGAPTEAPDPAP